MARFDISKVKVGDKVLVCNYGYSNHHYKVDTISRITKTTIALEKDTLYLYNADGDVRGGRARRYLMLYDEEFYNKWLNEHNERVKKKELINKIKGVNLEQFQIEKLEKILEVISNN